MPQANIYFDEEEDKKVEEFSNKWNMNKHDTVKKIIREFKDG